MIQHTSHTITLFDGSSIGALISYTPDTYEVVQILTEDKVDLKPGVLPKELQRISMKLKAEHDAHNKHS